MENAVERLLRFTNEVSFRLAVSRYNPTQNSGETMAGRIENLKPWPKGVSGNPAGRPKCDISSEIARAVFENNPEAIYQGMVRMLKKGDARVFKVLADRAYGKVKQNVELDPSEALVEQLQAARQRALERLSDDAINEQIRQLERELGYAPSIDEAQKRKSLSIEAGAVGASVGCK
jgi:hypothetical protein